MTARWRPSPLTATVSKKGERPKKGARLVRRPPSELERSMQTLADKAIAKGVPPDKL